MASFIPSVPLASAARATPAGRAPRPALRALTAVTLATAAFACGNKPGPPTGGTGEPEASGTGAVPADPGLGPPATAALVREAFEQKVPAFPLLSTTTGAVAVGLASPVGRSDVATYAIAIFTDWTGATDAWGSSALSYPVVDMTMAEMLLDQDGGAPLPDAATLHIRGAQIAKRLTDDGFTPFPAAPIALAAGDTELGPVALRFGHDAKLGLFIQLLDKRRTSLTTHIIQPYAMGTVAGLDCVSTPVPRRAWLDAPRKRVLVEIGWAAGANACNTPDLEYGVWAIP